MITTCSTSRRLTHPGLQPLTGTVLTAQELAARRQAEQAQAELQLARWHRIQAANDAVDEYMRTSGTRHYQAAFLHIRDTRPELFTDVPDSTHAVATANFNPYHDPLGRFTTSDAAVAPHGRGHRPDPGADLSKSDAAGQTLHLSYVGQLAPQKGGEAKDDPASNRPMGSIRDRAWGSPNDATCVAVGLRTLIATAKGLSEKDAPKLEDIQMKIEAEAGRLNVEIKAAIDKYNAHVKPPAKKLPMVQVTVNWFHGGVRGPGRDCAAIMQKVLGQYGVKSTAKLGDDPKTRMTMKELADALIAKGTPAMLNLGENPSNQHAITVQWDSRAGSDKQGRFLVNNIIAQGGTNEFTRGQFESGTLIDNEVRTHGSAVDRTFRPVIDLQSPVIFIEKP